MFEGALPRENPPGRFTNTRLAVCFAVATTAMSEGEACAYLGIDRVTFREIFSAAERWAEEMQRDLHQRHERRQPAEEVAAGPEGGGRPAPPRP